MRYRGKLYGAIAAVLAAISLPAHAGITNAVAALESEMTTGVGVIATSVQTVVLAALSIWGVFLVIGWFKRAVKK